MRALVLHPHGGLEQLAYVPNYRDPAIGPGDVLVRMRACALNYHDVFTRRGLPGIKAPLPIILGNDMAGDVAAVGAEVADFKVGDRALGDPIDREKGGLLGELLDA
jgi:alcohol dehydrogenase